MRQKVRAAVHGGDARWYGTNRDMHGLRWKERAPGTRSAGSWRGGWQGWRLEDTVLPTLHIVCCSLATSYPNSMQLSVRTPLIITCLYLARRSCQFYCNGNVLSCFILDIRLQWVC